MYKIFICLRYLRARLITYLATVLVAIGVMVFIVVLSVMSGFQTQFKQRIRGTLSHISLVRRMSDANYEAMEAELRDESRHPNIQAVAPRMRGLCLIGNRRQFEGVEIYGVDIKKEFEVGDLEEYLLTNLRLHELDLEELFNKSRQFSMEMALLGVQPIEGREKEKAAILVLDETLHGIFPKGWYAGYEQKEGRSARHQYRQILVADVEGKGLRIQAQSRVNEGSARAAAAEWKGEHRSEYLAFVEEFERRYNEQDAELILDLFDEKAYNRYGLQTDDPWARPPGAEDTGEDFRPVLVGIDLYRKFGLRRGSTIALTTGVENKQTGDIEPRKWLFTVVGMFKTGMVEWDQKTIYARLEDCMDTPEKEGYFGRSQVDEISVSLHDYQNAEDVQAELTKEFPDWLVLTWEDQRGNLLKAVELEKIVMGIILFMIVLLAVVTIMVVLILLVNEKTKDIGILRALGASRGGIIQVILTNGFVIGLVGSVIGAILGVAFVLNINGVEQEIHDTTGWTLYPRDVYYLDKIPDEVDPFDVMATVVITLSLCLILGFYPAWLAAKLDPVEAFRSE